MGEPHRHHLVSRGFQRAWTADGRRLLLVDIVERWAKPVSTRDAFFVPHLLTIRTREGRSAAAEEDFGRVESLALPDVRRFIDAGDRDGAAEAGVRAILALHRARSESLVDAMRVTLDEGPELVAAEMEADEHLEEIFNKHLGRPPVAAEVRRLLDLSAERMMATNTFFVERVVEHYNRAVSYFSGLYSQRVTVTRPGRVDLVFADSPVVIMADEQGTAAQIVPLRMADTLWCPLSPEVGVAFTTTPQPDVEASPIGAQGLNQLSLGYAKRFLGAHPRTDLDLALQKPAGTYQRPDRPARP